MTIEQLVSVLNNVEVKGDVNKEIEFITHDSRRVRKNTLFVCICGTRVDGNKFIPQAIEAGACAIMTEKDVEVPADITVIKVPNMREAMELAVPYFYDYPGKKMRMIGVTGTDGKTSTATIIYQLLNQISKCGYIGTNGVECPNYKDNSNNTTPTSEHLNRFLYNFYNNDCKYVSIETGSEGLAQGRCENIEFDYSVFTNLTHEHLNFHKTMENYLKAKSILFKQTKKDGISFLNIDDKYSKEIEKICNGKVYYYGKNKNADFRFENVKITTHNTTFDLIYNKTKYKIKSPLLGMFNVYNLTAALSVLLSMNIDINKLDLSNLYVDGRMNDIKLGQDFKVIVDYAHTPNG